MTRAQKPDGPESPATPDANIPLEVERKFHVAPVQAEHLAAAHCAHFVQTYILGDPDETARVRLVDAAGTRRFFHTVKRAVSAGVRSEHEVEVNADEYDGLLQHADPTRVPIVKTRYTFDHGGRTFELDELHEPRQLWLLEVEFADVAGLTQSVDLPPFIEVFAEVTEVDGFSTRILPSRNGEHPLIPIGDRRNQIAWLNHATRRPLEGGPTSRCW